jgi:hypothetical protein
MTAKSKALAEIDAKMLMSALVRERDQSDDFRKMFASNPNCIEYKFYENETHVLNGIIKSLYSVEGTLRITQ